MPIDPEELQAYIDNSATRKQELDALAAKNAAANAAAISALNQLSGDADSNGRISVAEQKAYLANKPTKVAGESNAAFNERITQWYKDQPHNPLTPEQEAAGATLEWVRTGAGGVGTYKVVYPIGVAFDKKTGQPIVPPKTAAAQDPNAGKTVVRRIQNQDGSYTVWYSDGTMGTEPGMLGGGFVPTGSANLVTGSSKTSSIGGTTTTTNTTTTANTAARQNMIAVMRDRFTKYGLTSLASKIEQLAIDGATEATITLQLQETPEYQQRFAANTARIQKGLTALTPADYLNLEDGYRQVLRSYGLTQFDNDAYVRQFIENDVSATELSNRVVTAVQRIQNADPAVAKTLRDYYGIGSTDLVAYMLDPNQNYQKIQRQVSAAEIGTAARLQGLEAGVSVAEQLAAQGISQAEAQKGYATIADILPTAEKLSQIYGTEQPYDQATAEQEVFNSLASAQRKRQKLTQRETAAFGGAAGTNKSSLLSSSTGQF